MDVLEYREHRPQRQQFHRAAYPTRRAVILTGRRYSAERNILEVSQLPAGVYNLTIIVNEKVYSKQFLKR